MKLNYTHWIGSFVALATIVSGCNCERPVTGGTQAEIVVEHVKDNVTLQDRDATYDFGGVFRGQRNADQAIVVHNYGSAALIIAGLEQVEGDDSFELGAPPAEGDLATFYVELEEGLSIQSGESAVIPVTFVPPELDDGSASSDHMVRLLMRTQNTFDNPDTEEDESVASITLIGRGISGFCEIESPINFGFVARGDTATRIITLNNPTDLDVRANVGEIRGGSTDRFAFEFATGSPQGDFVIPRQESKNVTILFKPTEAKKYLALVDMQAAKECPLVPVRIEGDGTDNVLTWDPPSLDCGAVTPTIEVTRDVTFTNLGGRDANLSEIKFGRPNEFRVVTSGDPSSLVVPANGGTATVTVGCKPGSLGNKVDSMTFKTDLARQPTGAISVKVFGGGPDINVRPSPNLTFGKVAFFPDVTQQATTARTLSIENVGTKPASSGDQYNLRLGVAPDFNAGGVTVVEANPDTQPGEFTVVFPSSYDYAKGLGATAADSLATLRVEFTPKSVGTKEADIVITSNDPDEASVTIRVSADATLLNPCNFRVVPSPTLDFGLVQPGDYRDLSVTVSNLATGDADRDVCLISGVRLADNGGGIFSLPTGEVTESQEIRAGQSYNVLVRVRPTGTASTSVNDVFGALEFFMSVKDTPQQSVQLKASVAQACLQISPDDWNFGTVEQNCNSSSREFTIVNACSGSVTVHSVTLQSAAGARVGDSQYCTAPKAGFESPAPGTCPEFVITQAATGLPATLTSSSAGIKFRARYEPIDFTADTGAIAVQATQNGTPVTYLITLRGRGDLHGYNEDSFTQDGQPKADILVVLDNSCSMGEEQAFFSANFDAFINYASAQGVDYHIGVITTDDSSASHKGRLVTGATHPETYLTPSTPNKAYKFSEKVKVGTSGSATEKCIEPAVKALTPPLTTTDNVGFLRDEAQLAVLCVSDARDQSLNTGAYYLNQFLGIKGFNRATDFSFNAIASFSDPRPAGCAAYDDGGDGPNGKLAYLVAQTNGVRDDICTTDWTRTLERIGTRSFGFRTTFFLTAIPDQSPSTGGPIQVVIDGDQIPRVDPDRGTVIWTYDPVQNAINFDPNYAPEAGDALTVSYTVACNPS